MCRTDPVADRSHGFKKIYVATGYTDLRRGIDGLATIIRFQFDLDPFDRDTLFLFCGRRSDRIKALLWEGDGFLLMYKRLNIGAFNWPRSADEAVEISQEEYERLMQGFEVIAKRPITEMKHPPTEL
ncbi:MAG: IS66 family insertion sequence element accessory protein TnpB [Anaerostipes sp.]|uniref:IS66 family insertion sequence element accessory protein TnpB n=1 Tax=Anaerostipes sp. TaxID=1872530 RepID=UPI00399A3DA2